MSKRRRTTLAISAVLLPALLVWAFFPSREPSYDGRSLSQWLIREADFCYEPPTHPFEGAMRHIGTNAVPYLLEWIQYDPSPWKTNLYHAVNRSLSSLNKKWKLTDKDEVLASQVDRALTVLGPKASAAIPELTRIMNDPKGGAPQQRAAYALGHLGEDAFHPLMAALTNQQGKVRLEALYAMGDLGTNGAPAVPVLVRYLRDQAEPLAWCAAPTLGRLGLEPKTVVPALMDTLNDPRQPVRLAAIGALSNFGSESSAAVPQLIPFLYHKDPAVASSAANALGRLKLQPYVVVPALAGSLRHDNPGGRAAALNALAEFGTHARPVTPALVKLLSDSEPPNVRRAATNALRAIDPQALEDATKP